MTYTPTWLVLPVTFSKVLDTRRITDMARSLALSGSFVENRVFDGSMGYRLDVPGVNEYGRQLSHSSVWPGLWRLLDDA